MDNLTIETPEQIQLEFPLAGVGSRFLALALDTLIQFSIGFVLVFLLLAVLSVIVTGFDGSGPWVLAIFILGAFLLQFGYFAFFEAIWNGQTPGKRLIHLRVIEDSGRPITVYGAMARNLLRIVDSLPGVYAVGIVSALASSQNKRLGDYVAGTVVVHERPLDQQSMAGWEPMRPRLSFKATFQTGSVLGLSPRSQAPTPAASVKVPSGYEASLLSDREFELIEAFLVRRQQLDAAVRAQMARQIVDKIAAKLNVRPEDLTRPETLLEKLAGEYREQSRYR